MKVYEFDNVQLYVQGTVLYYENDLVKLPLAKLTANTTDWFGQSMLHGIVKAYNHHVALVKALEGLMALVEAEYPKQQGEWLEESRAVLHDMQAYMEGARNDEQEK